jgi:hypothetical protein
VNDAVLDERSISGRYAQLAQQLRLTVSGVAHSCTLKPAETLKPQRNAKSNLFKGKMNVFCGSCLLVCLNQGLNESVSMLWCAEGSTSLGTLPPQCATERKTDLIAFQSELMCASDAYYFIRKTCP